MCPEQECECLVYYSDQSRSMIDILGLGQDPFLDDRVKAFHEVVGSVHMGLKCLQLSVDHLDRSLP